MLFGLVPGGNHQIDQAFAMSTNEPGTSVRPVRKQKQLRGVRHVSCMYDDRGSNLDLVEFNKSSIESESEGLPLTQQQQRQQAQRQFYRQ